ncbi:MAG: acyl carrier protein [Flammeovirgaceae bacterium]|jgi:acyl carrier protein
MKKQERQEIETKIRELMSLVFRLDQGEIDEATTSNSVRNWDSLQHMNLIALIEDEFDIQLQPSQINKMNSFLNIIEEVYLSLH